MFWFDMCFSKKIMIKDGLLLLIINCNEVCFMLIIDVFFGVKSGRDV